MVCLGARGVNIQKALLPQLQAVIHIVVGHGELLLVQTAAFAVQRCLCHQAGAGHGHIILRCDKAVHIAHSGAGVALVAVARTAVDAHQHTGMLDRIVRVVELGTHGTHIGALAVAEQLAQEVGRQNFNVVIEQQQMLTLGKRCAEVVDG